MVPYLKYLSISLLFVTQLSATSWMVLPTEYAEFSGPYGFLFDEKDQPHVIMGSWRNSINHEFLLRQDDDKNNDLKEEPVFALYHAVRQGGQWTTQVIDWDLEQTSTYALTGSNDGLNLWLVRLTQSGNLQALQWDGSSWSDGIAPLSTTPASEFAADQDRLPFRLETVEGDGCAWINLINTNTGVIHFYQLNKNGFHRPLPSYSPNPPIEQQDSVSLTNELYLDPNDPFPRFVLQQKFAHTDQEPILIGHFEESHWTTKSIKTEPKLFDGFIKTRISKTNSHAASYIVSSGLCYFHEKKDGTWSRQVLDSSAWAHCDLELDNEGNPWILYGSNDGGIREYPIALAYKEEDTWQFKDVAPSSTQMDLKFSHNGKPFIAFSDLTGVYFSEYKKGQWHRQLIAGSGEGGGQVTDIKVDRDGTLCLLISAQEGLFYLTKKDNQWNKILVSPLGMGGLFDDYYFHDDNTPRKIYFWELHGGLWQYTLALLSSEGVLKHPLTLTASQPRYWLFHNPDSVVDRLKQVAYNNQNWDHHSHFHNSSPKSLRPNSTSSDDFIGIGAYQYVGRTLAVVAQHAKEYNSPTTIWVAFENDEDPENNEYKGNHPMHFEKLDTSAQFKAATISPYGSEGWQVIVACGDGFLYQFTKEDFDQPTIKEVIGKVNDVAEIKQFDAGYLIETNDPKTSKRALTFWSNPEDKWIQEPIFTSLTWGMHAIGQSAPRDPENPIAPPSLFVAFHDSNRNVSILATRSPDGIWTLEDIPTRLP